MAWLGLAYSSSEYKSCRRKTIREIRSYNIKGRYRLITIWRGAAKWPSKASLFCPSSKIFASKCPAFAVRDISKASIWPFDTEDGESESVEIEYIQGKVLKTYS